MRFLHIATTKEDKPHVPLSKETFRRPHINKDGAMYMHGFNMDNALYLSQAYPNGESDWLISRRWHETNFVPSRSRPTFEDSWIPSPHRYYFDVDFKEHHIYVINTPEELLNFYIKYCGFSQRPINGPTERTCSPENKRRYRLYKMNKILIDFITNLSPSNRAKLDDITTVIHIKDIRNRRNMQLIKLRKMKVDIPRKGINLEFLVDIIRTIEFNEIIVGDPSNIYTQTYIMHIDFPRMVADGYNGLYYSRNLVRQNTEPFDDTIKHGYNCVAKIDIGEMPDLLGDTSAEDLLEMKREIEDYIRWLGSDTLILWEWIFD